jgi:tetratricopeptide repeat protein
MYPQMTGTLKVPPLTFHGVIQVPNSFNPFEAFGIDGGSTSFKKDVVAPELAIKVLPLPNRPANFSGGVGHFNLSAQLNKKEIKAGNPITIRVVVSGAGNLKLIKQPIIQIPKGVESYDVKVTDKTQLTTKGAEGNMIYDQVVIPHQEGLVAIPPVKFCYYDLSQKKYITLQTEPMDLVVSRGDGSSKDILSVDLPNEDILPLKKGDSTLDNIGNLFFGSTVYYIILILLLSIGGGLSFYYRKRFAYRVDMVFKRGKNANRIASSRLRAAELLMLKNKNLDFYDEVLQTLWGYASDKLNLPVEHLSRENLSEQFSKIDIAKEVIDNYISAIDECEFERYAPGDEKGNMKRTLTVAMKAIADMEEAIKKLKSSKKKAFLFLPLLFCLSFFFSAQLSAQTKSDVDNLYQKGNYVQAVKGYEKLLKQGESAALYYNLGNCYYRLDNIPHAVLSYERAQRLAPSDEDIRFNLQLAQSKTIDNLTPESEMIFVTWYKALVNLFSIDSWAYLSLVCLFISIVALVVYLFVDIEILRKLSKIVLPLFFFFFLINTFFAIQQVYLLDSETHGIIMSPSAVVRKMPDQKSADSFILHEGSKVRIIDNSMSQWTEIKLSDGRQGWIKADNVEAI